MRSDWLSRLVAVTYRRTVEPGNRAGGRDVDALGVRGELDAIRVRFLDHA